MGKIISVEERRRDRFDMVISEYLRANKKSVEDLCEKVGCSTSSLWRYRYTVQGFLKMPTSTFGECMKVANVSNENLRIILGLPTGLKNNTVHWADNEN